MAKKTAEGFSLTGTAEGDLGFANAFMNDLGLPSVLEILANPDVAKGRPVRMNEEQMKGTDLIMGLIGASLEGLAEGGRTSKRKK